MGSRGPAPKPSRLRLVEGGHKGRSAVSHRPVPMGEPSPALASGEIPPGYKWLKPLAREFWARNAPELVRMRILAVTHLDKWAVTCQCYARLVELELRAGVSQRDLETARQAFNRFSALFGLSPADQVRVQTLDKPREEDDDKW